MSAEEEQAPEEERDPEYCTECRGSGFRYYLDGGRDLCEGCGGTGSYS